MKPRTKEQKPEIPISNPHTVLTVCPLRRDVVVGEKVGQDGRTVVVNATLYYRGARDF